MKSTYKFSFLMLTLDRNTSRPCRRAEADH